MGGYFSKLDCSSNQPPTRRRSSTRQSYSRASFTLSGAFGFEEKTPASLFEELMDACRIGDSFLAHKALNEGADPNWRDEFDDDDFLWTPLGEACVDGNEEIVSLLLERGADVHEPDYEGKTPLHVASLRNNIGVVSLLLQEGKANPNFKNKFGRTALHDACQSGNKMIVEILLNYGANPNMQYKCPLTPLHHACWNSSQEIASVLLKAEASTLAQNIDTGATPVHYAVKNRDAELTSLLCEHGVDLHHLDQNCNSVMSLARDKDDSKSLATVRELIKAKLKKSSYNARG